MTSPAPARPPGSAGDPYAYGDTIHGVFAWHAARQPTAAAVISGNEVVTYADLAAAAEALAATFAGRGVAPGSIAVVRMRRTPVFAAVLLALLRLGGAYLAAEQAWPRAYLQGLLDRADAWVITDDPQVGLNSPLGTILVDAARLPRSSASAPDVPVSRDAPCTIFQTSGSTGTPKLAVVPHRATLRAFIGADYADFGPGRVILQASPVCWDGLTMELWSVLLSGGTSLIPPQGVPVSGDLLRSCSADHGLDTIWLTSSLFNALVDDDIGAFAAIRQVMSGGERVSPDHVRALRSRYPGIRFSSGYGPVETTVFATSHTVADGDLDRYGEVPIGRPLPATTVLVLNESGDPCSAGEIGEIHVGGDALGLGYLRDQTETRKRYVTSPHGGRLFRTGDLGQWHETGVLLFRGRVDRQLKVRGQRVEPEELEKFTARAIPGLTTAVTPMRDPHGQIIGLALHCGTGGRDISATDLRSACAAGLPPHLRPRRIIVSRELPRTDNGKVDYAALEAVVAVPRNGERTAGEQVPAGSVEDRITRVASSLLGIPVGSADDFFDAGGDSLLAMRLSARLRHDEGIELPVTHIHRERSIGRLAEFAVPVKDGSQPESGATTPDLSPGEEDLFIHEEIFPGDPSLLVASAYELSEDIDIETLRAAMVATCARHSALSTVRVREGATVHARALTPEEVGLRLKMSVREEVLAEHDGSVQFPRSWLGAFDLTTDLPLRAYVTSSSTGVRQLALVIHHVAMDGWSEHIFLADLSRAYDSLTENVTVTEQSGAQRHPALTRISSPEQRERARDYWRALLDDLDSLPIPKAHPDGDHFAETRLPLTEAHCAALAGLTGRHADLHAGALAWYADSLRHTFGLADFAIGSAYAARDLTDEDSIGYHVQMIPVRIRDADRQTVASLSASISQQWLCSLDHRSLSLREIAACAKGTHPRGHRPVFQCGFALQRESPAYLELGGQRNRRLPVRPPAAPFELYLELWPEPDNGAMALLQWDTTSVSASSAQRMADRLLATSAQLV